jgi:hypothetical protein
MHSQAGQIVANTYDTAERERLRAVLIAYMKQHKIGVPTLARRIIEAHPRRSEVPRRTLQRFLAGKRVNDMAVSICATFAENLPSRPTAFHALGRALHDLYQREPDHIAGVYAVSTHETIISQLTIGPFDPRFLTVKEVTTSSHRRIYDGVLVNAGRSIVAILKDSLMNTARIYTLHLNPERLAFYGLLYDSGPLESGGPAYQSLQVALERTGHAE